jgi:hydroxyacylglutathione hydrolase
MQATEHIHAIRIPFRIPVGPGKTIERVVYSYIVFVDKITLIDSGVSEAEKAIFSYLEQNGRRPDEVSALILTHSHPDHIGSAKAIKDATGCSVLAHQAEKHWIEDTERQFRERPVPGFHALVRGPVAVDRMLSDAETLELSKNITCKVTYTPGHSAGSISLLFGGDKAIISGDVLPLPGDLPIYENIIDCAASIGKLGRSGDVETLLSSWEAPIYGHEAIKQRYEDGMAWLRKIHETVLKAGSTGKQDAMDLCRYVVGELGLPPFAANPLVARAFASSLEAEKNGPLFGP